jgi:hypothetical protein
MSDIKLVYISPTPPVPSRGAVWGAFICGPCIQPCGRASNFIPPVNEVAGYTQPRYLFLSFSCLPVLYGRRVHHPPLLFMTLDPPFPLFPGTRVQMLLDPLHSDDHSWSSTAPQMYRNYAC